MAYASVFTSAEIERKFRNVSSVDFFDKDKVIPLSEDGLLFGNSSVDELLVRSVEKKGNIYYWFFERLNSDTWEIWAAKSDATTDPLRLYDYSATRLFEPGAAGSDDELGQADPSIMYDADDDIWRLWFENLNTTAFETISYATCAGADDPTVAANWTNQGIIMRVTSSNWKNQALHHPSVIKVDGLFYMYYCGRSNEDGYGHKIGVAVSKDGQYFEDYPNNPIISPVTYPNDYDDYQIRTSKPFKIGNIWYMVYWGRASGYITGETPDRNLLARSSDLVNWEKTEIEVFGADSFREGGSMALAVHHDETNNALLFLSKARKGINSGGYFHKFWAFPTDLLINGERISDFAGEYEYGDQATEEVGSFGANTVYYLEVEIGASGGYLNGFGWTQGEAPQNMKIGVYDDDSGSPGSLVADSSIEVLGLDSINFIYKSFWNRAFLTTNNPQLLANTTYWIAFLSDESWRGPKSESTDTGSGGWTNESVAYATGLPATATPGSVVNRRAGVYLILSSQPNILKAAVANEPEFVAFNGEMGNKESTKADLTAVKDWLWDTGELFVYTEGDPARKYFAPGVTVRTA